MLTNFMQQQCRWPLMKALLGKGKLLGTKIKARVTFSVGLIRNLALTPENLPVLFENQCVDSLWQILNRASQESHRRGISGGPSGYVVCVTAVIKILWW